MTIVENFAVKKTFFSDSKYKTITLNLTEMSVFQISESVVLPSDFCLNKKASTVSEGFEGCVLCRLNMFHIYFQFLI